MSLVMIVHPSFISLLFCLAVTLSPTDTSQIVITGPTETWTWTKQDTGWSQTVDHSANPQVDRSLWWFHNNLVINTIIGKNNGAETITNNEGHFIKAVTDHDWNKSPSLKIRPYFSLTKNGKSFVFLQYRDDRNNEVKKRFVIEFTGGNQQKH
jgi:hypothetical protein